MSNSRTELLAHAALYGAKTYRIVHRYGWTVDDCKQEAVAIALQLLRDGALNPDDPGALGYLAVSVRRGLVRVAKTALHDGTGVYVCDALDPLSEADYALIDVNDLLDRAPPDVAVYMSLRVYQGLSWEEAKKKMEVSNYRLSDIRAKAALWLLAQYEGKRI